MSKYVLTLRGAAINLSSEQQQTVALSSTEAEYMALCFATQKAIYYNCYSTTLDWNNLNQQPSTKTTKNQQLYFRHAKYIEIKYHFAQEQTK